MTAPKLKSIISDKIPTGTKFVAIFYDGSGARLFMKRDSGNLLDSDEKIVNIQGYPEDYLQDHTYGFWIELPKDFPLWFEQKKEAIK